MKTNWNLKTMLKKSVEQIYVESTKTHRKEVSIWRLCIMVSKGVSKGEKTHLGKFKKRWFGPFRVQ
jgi:hypothetical protein